MWVGTRKVNCRAATELRMAAQSLHDSKSALGDFYRRMRAKPGAPKGITAAAQKLARILFHLMTTGQEFDDSRFAADRLRYQKRQEIKLRAKAKAKGSNWFLSNRPGSFHTSEARTPLGVRSDCVTRHAARRRKAEGFFRCKREGSASRMRP